MKLRDAKHLLLGLKAIFFFFEISMWIDVVGIVMTFYGPYSQSDPPGTNEIYLHQYSDRSGRCISELAGHRVKGDI
jgi:hypothetical protein